MSDTKTKNPPVYVHRDGSVFAKVWENLSDDGRAFYNVTVGKTYTDPNTGKPCDSNNLQKNDLLKAQFLMGEAYRTVGQMQGMQVRPEHTKPPIVQDHTQAPSSGLEAQRDQALAQATTTPNKSNGVDSIAHQNAPDIQQ